jgi:hypothetical protein
LSRCDLIPFIWRDRFPVLFRLHLVSHRSSNSPFCHLFAPSCSRSSIRDSAAPLLAALRMDLLHVPFFRLARLSVVVGVH